MVTEFYLVDDPYAPEFIEAMENLQHEIECYVEAVNLFTVLVECEEKDLAIVEEYFAPFV